MFKTNYFTNRFSKIVKCLEADSFRCWWSEVAWFGQIVFFKLIMTKSNLKSY